MSVYECLKVGTRIKDIRKSKGITQKQLGELCGIAEPNIRKYELGKANPKIETLNKIANALDVPVSNILEITDKAITQDTDDNRIKYIANRMGLETQLEQTVEECSELILAIQKWKRYEKSPMTNELALNVNEEVADVLIMANQLRHLMGEDFIDSIVNAKLERQIERIAKGGHDGETE